MSSRASYAELEISLVRSVEAAYQVGLRYDNPDSAAEIAPVRGTSSIVPIDFLELQDGPNNQYGKELAARLFEDPNVQTMYGKVKAAVESSGQFLRVKLLVDPSAPELHPLRWELLVDPETDAPLATSERILFSRFGHSDDWRTVTLRPRGELRALVAVSSPSDLASQGLAPVDVDGEIARASEHLKGIQVEVAGKDEEPVTLDRLIEGLGGGVDILYLVCHGALVEKGKQGASLWLQKPTGEIAPVRGDEFARRIGELAEPPRLVVLASCESAGSEAVSTREGVIAGQLVPLAPLLAEAGVHAVVAMQGRISMETVKTAMPVFFSELLVDGQIDRAMARARGRVREHSDSWMPALFLRLKDGRIWQESPGSETLEGLADLLADGDLPRVEELDPYRLGATASDYGASDSYGQDDPYVPRSIDGRLRAALRPGPLVLLVGPSKAGKTRTAFEALRSAWARARMVVPAVGALERLAAHSRLRNTADPVVIWFDDIHRYLTGAEQLTPALLARLTGRPGDTVVVGTLRIEERVRLRGDTGELSRDTRSLLDAASATTFELTSTVQDPDEQAVARAAYPGEDLLDLGLAERLANAPTLLQAYRDAAIADPLGHVLIRTAIDWERVGGPEPIPEPDLKALVRAALREERPDLKPDEQMEEALKWATKALPGSGRAVLLTTVPLPGPDPGYWPFSYLVAADDGQTGASRPIPDEFWTRVTVRLTPESTTRVGVSAYHRGNISAAIEATRKGADAGVSDAMNGLGVLLAGLDPPQLVDARVWFQQAAATGHSEAMFNLGLLFFRLDPPQLDDARDWFQQAAAAGHGGAMNNLGVLVERLDPSQLDDARDWYERAAAAGHSGAMFNLGLLLERLDPPQLDDARVWYERAAAAGHSKAMNNLGLLLSRLDPPQPNKARKCFQQAAAAGDRDAMNNLGLLLARLDPPQPNKARKCFEQAAAAGDRDAMNNLGVLLAGLDPPQLDDARDWYEKAAAAGHSGAMFNLGMLLAHLDPPQLDDARDWHEKAAAAGDSDAMNNLGLLMVSLDPPQLDDARDWFQRAAAAGHSDAMFNLGLLFFHLDPPQLHDARVWFQRAAAAGHSDAMNNLALLPASSDAPEPQRD